MKQQLPDYISSSSSASTSPRRLKSSGGGKNMKIVKVKVDACEFRYFVQKLTGRSTREEDAAAAAGVGVGKDEDCADGSNGSVTVLKPKPVRPQAHAQLQVPSSVAGQSNYDNFWMSSCLYDSPPTTTCTVTSTPGMDLNGSRASCFSDLETFLGLNGHEMLDNTVHF